MRGLALVTGAISGGLEALDFDSRSVYRAWSEGLQQSGFDAFYDRLTRGYLEATPNGVHLLYRSCHVERNQKLASAPVDGSQRLRTLIKTRGEGGLVVVAPSGGGVHPSGEPYMLLAGGITTIATITPEERQALFSVARAFDQTPPKYLPSRVRQQLRAPWTQRQRPGDRYNRHASWAEVLDPLGRSQYRWTNYSGGYYATINADTAKSGLYRSRLYTEQDRHPVEHRWIEWRLLTLWQKVALVHEATRNLYNERLAGKEAPWLDKPVSDKQLKALRRRDKHLPEQALAESWTGREATAAITFYRWRWVLMHPPDRI